MTWRRATFHLMLTLILHVHGNYFGTRLRMRTELCSSASLHSLTKKIAETNGDYKELLAGGSLDFQGWDPIFSDLWIWILIWSQLISHSNLQIIFFTLLWSFQNRRRSVWILAVNCRLLGLLLFTAPAPCIWYIWYSTCAFSFFPSRLPSLMCHSITVKRSAQKDNRS